MKSDASHTGRSYTLVERIYASILARLIMLAPSVIAGTLIGASSSQERIGSGRVSIYGAMTSPNTNAVGFGGMLGFFNTLFIAIGVCTYTHEGVGIGVVVFMFGVIPGLITGMSLGAFASGTARLDVWLRRVMLCLPAVGVLLGIAEFFSVGELFLPAAIPTIVCALILERNTRYVAPVPAAVVR
jgi:hypothetical protein